MNTILKEQHQQAEGFVQCFVVDAASGSVVKEYPKQKNLILNQGMDQVAVNYWADLFAYCSAGNGVAPTSDDSGLTTASQSGNALTLNGGSFTLTSTLVDGGNLIKWDTGEEAMITVVASGTSATVANSASVGAGQFTVYRTNQTQLGSQLKRTNNYLAGLPYTGSVLTSNVLKMRRTFDFTAEVSGATYTEIALGWNNVSVSAIFSRILLTLPVPVLTGQQLRVTYELRITVTPSAPVSKTAIIGGWPVAPAATTDGVECVQYLGIAAPNTSGTSTIWDGGGWSSEPSSASFCGVFVSDTATRPASFGGAIARTNTGSANTTTAAYIAGSWYVDKSGTLSVGVGNSSAIRSMGYGYHQPNNIFASTSTTIVFVFNEAQTKLNTHTLTLTYRFSWSRVLS